MDTTRRWKDATAALDISTSTIILSALPVMLSFSFLILLHTAMAQSLLSDSATMFGADHVSTSGNIISLRMDHSGGAQTCSQNQYSYGTFSALIKCPDGDINGFAPSFYTTSDHTGTGDHDEIDFEFLGNNPQIVQTNYFVDGQGEHEQTTPLGFDCSSDFHKYTIQWTSSSIEWFIDDIIVRTVTNDGSSPYPTKPGYLCASIWDASSIGDGNWVGVATYANSPYYFQLQGVSVSDPLPST